MTIFEARDVPGGMMRLVPPFRLPREIIQRDIDRITALGVEIRLNTPITGPPEELLQQGFDAVYLASGFQRDAPLRVPGVEGPGVVPALHLLDRSRRGERVDLGRKVVVIGGGDTAMDAVRTAQRLTGDPVTILYRRTRHEMPAAAEELDGALEEGNVLEELVAPRRGPPRATAGSSGSDACATRWASRVRTAGARRSQSRAASSWCRATRSSSRWASFRSWRFSTAAGVTRHRAAAWWWTATTRSAGPDGVYAGGDVVDRAGQHHRGVRRRPQGRRGHLRAPRRRLRAAVGAAAGALRGTSSASRPCARAGSRRSAGHAAGRRRAATSR